MQVLDEKADFKQTVERYKNTVYGAVLASLNNKADADDVFQETFLLYYKKDLYFENEAARKAWLIKTALTLCKKANMSIWSIRVDRLDDKENELVGEDMLSESENDVMQAVRSLDRKLREPTYLYYFEDMTIKEIAQILGIKSGAVQVRLVRARKLLKEKLKGEYFYE